MTGKRPKRSISDEEVALIRAMLRRGIDKTTIQAYFTHPDRRVNFGRVTNIEREVYGSGIVAATDQDLDRFLEGWRAARGAPIQTVAEAAVDLSSLSPVDPKRLLALFEQTAGQPPRLRDGETEEIECKLSFHHPNNDKVLKAVAALANNRGGHILFGVHDDTAEIVGLKDDRFITLDPNVFSMTIRSAIEPTPHFDIGHLRWEDKLVGAIYIHAERDRPVIASKDEGSFKAGTIYYRYPGESRGIAGADFRRILLERERKARADAAELARKVIELGGDAAVLDLATGKVEGSSSGFYLSPELLPKIQFIKEGQFNETEGAATLKLVGHIEIANAPKSEVVREKIVRQRIKDADVLRNFLDLETVEAPAEYVLHGCHTGKHYLPLFYYARQTGLTKQALIDLIANEQTSHDAVKGVLMDRAHGTWTARAASTPASQLLTEAIRSGRPPNMETLAEIRKLAVQLCGFRDATIPVKDVLDFLKQLVTTARTLGQPDTDPGYDIRKAATWIDELYFRSDVPDAPIGSDAP